MKLHPEWTLRLQHLHIDLDGYDGSMRVSTVTSVHDEDGAEITRDAVTHRIALDHEHWHWLAQIAAACYDAHHAARGLTVPERTAAHAPLTFHPQGYAGLAGPAAAGAPPALSEAERTQVQQQIVEAKEQEHAAAAPAAHRGDH